MKKCFLWLCFFLSFSQCCFAEIETAVSRNKVALGETFTLSFTVTNGSRATPDFTVLEKDFRILRSNYGSSIKVINGSMTSQTFWQLTLEPKNTGNVTIPEIIFGNDKSVSQQLTVVENTEYNRQENEVSNLPVFTRAEVSTTSPYIQGQVHYTAKLFYQSQLENLRIEAPQIQDAKVVQLDEGKIYQTVINGQSYAVAEKNFAIFPQKSGQLTLPPARFHALTLDMDTSMMNGPFYIAAPKPLTLSTKSYTLTVRKTPENYQGSTWLPANNLRLTENWSVEPNQWEAGNPVTRTITLEAEGLRADQLPDLAIEKIPGVNIYVDPPQRNNSLQNGSVLGTLEQKVTYIPDVSQLITVPAIKINWWNTQINTNAVAQLSAITLKVIGKVTNSTIAPIQNEVYAPKTQEKIQPVTKTIPTSFDESIWFWATLFILVLWLITLGFFLRLKKQPTKIKEINPKQVELNNELNDATFTKACEQGNAVLAQQFLLNWAKHQWQDMPLNLEKLREMINDECFKQALAELEQAIYAKKMEPWNGQTLLSAYQQMKRKKKNKRKHQNKQVDPLPPLNPPLNP